MARKNEIKEQIAHLLMRSNVGLVENAIIQQVTATANVNAITEALKNMKNVSEVMLDGKRWKITPIGRSIYSDLNAVDSDDNDIEEPAKPAPTSNSLIELIPMHKTPDGKLHESIVAAEQHLFEIQLTPRIDKFFESIGSPARQHGLITYYIKKWELFNRETAA
jgi:hypothetical protein